MICTAEDFMWCHRYGSLPYRVCVFNHHL